MKKSKNLLSDEPSLAIDPESTASIINTLQRLKKDITIVLVNHNRQAIDKTDNIITIDNKRVVEIVEDGIVKEIELEGDSSIAYSRDSLKYIFVPDNNKEDKNTMASNTNQNPTTESSSIKKEQASDLLQYKFIGRSARQRRINVVLIGERFNPQLRILVIAGQHGDEKYGRIATERLIGLFAKHQSQRISAYMYCDFPRCKSGWFT